jgi:hypothetical protein
VKTHKRWTTFHQKEVMYKECYNRHYAKILMVSFDYPKHKQKTLKFAWQHFETQGSLWIKINFDSTVKSKGLEKIMYM